VLVREEIGLLLLGIRIHARIKLGYRYKVINKATCCW